MDRETNDWEQWALEQCRRLEAEAAKAPPKPRKAPATWEALFARFLRKWRHLNPPKPARRKAGGPLPLFRGSEGHPTMLTLQPISFRDAGAFIRQHHRHHRPPQGCKFCIAASDGQRVVAVAVVGRPVARMLDDGWTAEVTRLCTDGTANAASMLYAACWRMARGMGYRRLITYILDTEPGTSVRAAGWREVGRAGGGRWSRPSRIRTDEHPTGQKLLFEID